MVICLKLKIDWKLFDVYKRIWFGCCCQPFAFALLRSFYGMTAYSSSHSEIISIGVGSDDGKYVKLKGWIELKVGAGWPANLHKMWRWMSTLTSVELDEITAMLVVLLSSKVFVCWLTDHCKPQVAQWLRPGSSCCVRWGWTLASKSKIWTAKLRPESSQALNWRKRNSIAGVLLPAPTCALKASLTVVTGMLPVVPVENARTTEFHGLSTVDVGSGLTRNVLPRSIEFIFVVPLLDCPLAPLVRLLRFRLGRFPLLLLIMTNTGQNKHKNTEDSCRALLHST